MGSRLSVVSQRWGCQPRGWVLVLGLLLGLAACKHSPPLIGCPDPKIHIGKMGVSPQITHTYASCPVEFVADNDNISFKVEGPVSVPPHPLAPNAPESRKFNSLGQYTIYCESGCVDEVPKTGTLEVSPDPGT
jgi:hypothetical protein